MALGMASWGIDMFASQSSVLKEKHNSSKGIQKHPDTALGLSHPGARAAGQPLWPVVDVQEEERMKLRSLGFSSKHTSRKDWGAG